MVLKPALSKCTMNTSAASSLGTNPKPGSTYPIKNLKTMQDFTKELNQPLLKKGHTILIDVRTMQLHPQCLYSNYFIKCAVNTDSVIIHVSGLSEQMTCFQSGVIVPYQGTHVWDSHHVKLPHLYVSTGIQSAL